MFFTHKNVSLSFTIYKSCFVAVRAIEPSGRLTVARYLLNVTVYPLFVTFDTDKKLFRKFGMHNVSFNFTEFFSFLFNLTFTTTSLLPIDFTECSAAVYTVDCLSLSRIVNAFLLLHICFVAPVSFTQAHKEKWSVLEYYHTYPLYFKSLNTNLTSILPQHVRVFFNIKKLLDLSIAYPAHLNRTLNVIQHRNFNLITLWYSNLGHISLRNPHKTP